MKRVIILLLIMYSNTIFSQINLSGNSNYELSISGYVGEDSKACGDIYGLREIKVVYSDGTIADVWIGRIFNENFTHQLSYTYHNPIVEVRIKEINRWKTFIGCNGGPNNFFTNIPIDNGCFNYFDASIGHQLKNLTIVSKPVVNIIDDGKPRYLGDTELLNIDIPDRNISKNFYRWYYRVGSGSANLFDSQYNYKSRLELLGNDFLNPSDFGKTISVWIDTGCGSISNTIVFTYQKSAPYITAIDPQQTTCFDSEDGSVKLMFDRALAPANAEVLSIRIEDISEPEGTNPDGSIRYRRVGGQDNINVLDTDNSIAIGDLPKSTTEFKIVIAGTFNGVAYYTDGVDHTRNFMIEYNPPVAFTEKPRDSKVDVWCFDGEDGEITINAKGGTGADYWYILRVKGETAEDWVAFDNPSSNTQIITGLAPDIYELKLKDGNDCVARKQEDVNGEIKLGDDIIEEVEIVAPQNELTIEYTGFKLPTAFGLTDGFIVATITGGTIKDDNSYNYIWKDENGNILTSITTEFTNNAYSITLNDVGAGTYNLTITDKNYINATDNAGCTIVNSSYFLDQPKPLSVTIEILEEISCNSSNQYNSEIDDDANGIPNEAQDGALVAHAKGGIRLGNLDNNGLPYYYTWKQKDANGNWVVLSEGDSIVRNLNVGDYALNIKDKNGIVLGEYVNNVLINEIDSTFYLPEPLKLQTVMTANKITCNNGKNGEVKVAVSGGTRPYTYLWNTGDTTEEVTGLSGGKYFVYVTDAKGCQIQDNVTIEQPEGIEIELVTKVDPICSYSNDGEIEVSIKGGLPPYTLKWNTDETTLLIQNLIAGNYELTITDGNGCNAFFAIELESVAPLIVDLGEDRILCGGQSFTIDATIEDNGASYQWTSTNGFASNSPIVDLIEAGTYTVSVTSSKGCVATDEIVISTKDIPIDASFLLSSQAYTDTSIELANVSNPRGERTEWVVPDEAVIVEKDDEHLTVKFRDPGEYEISMLSYVDDCYKEITKNILVEENTNLPDVGDADNPFIVEFVVYPNPNNGVFDVKIVLAEESSISLRLVSVLTNDMLLKKQEMGSKEYNIHYNVNLALGVYFIVLETPNGTEMRKVIIQ